MALLEIINMKTTIKKKKKKKKKERRKINGSGGARSFRVRRPPNRIG